jgi:hypothetical protein
MMQRIRHIGKQKGEERVLVSGKYETLTSTQAYRFQELRDVEHELRAPEDALPKDKPWYALAEASTRLSLPSGELLAMAAAGTLRIYVDANGLRGRWRGERPHGDAPALAYLAVPADNCRDIAAYGSANVAVLEHGLDDGRQAEFELQTTLWVDPARLILKHPLPAL